MRLVFMSSVTAMTPLRTISVTTGSWRGFFTRLLLDFLALAIRCDFFEFHRRKTPIGEPLLGTLQRASRFRCDDQYCAVAISAGDCTNAPLWAFKKPGFAKPRSILRERRLMDSLPSTSGTIRSWNPMPCSCSQEYGRSARVRWWLTGRAARP